MPAAVAPTSPEVAIDPHTGILAVGSVAIFCPRRPLPNRTEALHLLAPRDMRTGYVWHDYEGATFGGRPCVLRVCVFQGDGVQRIKIDPFLGVPHWVNEMDTSRRVAIGRFILSNLLERPFETGTEHFPWGVAYSAYDDKSGAASIGLRYDWGAQRG
jgi:hypothetical protein